MAAKRANLEEKLSRVRALADDPANRIVEPLRALLRDDSGVVVAAAAALVADKGIAELAEELEEAFARLFASPAKKDPGCRGKLAAVDALRRLRACAREVAARGLSYRQPEPAFGGPVDAAGPLRVACARALLESGDPWAPAEVAGLLADPEANVRLGAADALGDTGSIAAQALLRLKVRAGDAEPDVLGACLQGLLHADAERNLAFVGETAQSEDPDVARLSLVALGESRRDDAFPLLRARAEDEPRAEVRAAALLGVSLLRSEAANAFLLDVLANAPIGAATAAAEAVALQRWDRTFLERARAVAEERDPRLAAMLERA